MGENLSGYLKNALTITLCVGAGLSGGQGLGELALRHVQVYKKTLQTGNIPVYIYIRGLSPFYVTLVGGRLGAAL